MQSKYLQQMMFSFYPGLLQFPLAYSEVFFRQHLWLFPVSRKHDRVLHRNGRGEYDGHTPQGIRVDIHWKRNEDQVTHKLVCYAHTHASRNTYIHKPHTCTHTCSHTQTVHARNIKTHISLKGYMRQPSCLGETKWVLLDF